MDRNPAPERRNDGLAEAWAEFCSKVPWVWFATLTFDDARHKWGDENRERAVRLWLNRIDRAANRADGPVKPAIIRRVYAAGSTELTCAKAVHFHLLVGGVGHSFRFFWMEEWNRMAGFARIYAYDQGRAEMNKYCFKYVCKGGHNAESWWHNLEIPCIVSPNRVAKLGKL